MLAPWSLHRGPVSPPWVLGCPAQVLMVTWEENSPYQHQRGGLRNWALPLHGGLL